MKQIKITKNKFAIVDDNDYLKLIQYKWQYHLGYAKRGQYNKKTKNNDSIKMHRQILSPPKNMVIHHINGNRLDNRKENLLVCSQRDNHRSQIQNNKSKTTSKYQGVYLRKYPSGKYGWVVRVKVDYKNKWIGSFKTEEEAALAYNIAALKYHGIFAVQNKII